MNVTDDMIDRLLTDLRESREWADRVELDEKDPDVIDLLRANVREWLANIAPKESN